MVMLYDSQWPPVVVEVGGESLSNNFIAYVSVCEDWLVESFSDTGSDEEDFTRRYQHLG